MRFALDPRRILKMPGRLESAFGISLGIYLTLVFSARASWWTTLAEMFTLVFGGWIVVRLARAGVRKAIWRLRNRLLVTYLFLAAVPVLLLAAFAGIGAWALTSQVAVYLVTSELDRRIASLRSATESIEKAAPSTRTPMIRSMADLFYRERFPGVEFLLRDAVAGDVRYPPESGLTAPPKGWKPTSGVVRKDGRFYVWSYAETKGGDVTVLAPMTRDFLDRLAPNLGLVYFLQDVTLAPLGSGLAKKAAGEGGETSGRLPPAANRLDFEERWFGFFPSSVWEKPNRKMDSVVAVTSRPSAVLATFISRKSDWVQTLLPTLVAIVAALFLVMEMISLGIGISMTRTITGAVHHLYEGTQRVIDGDFSHRIEVKGGDQLADLSRSFNRMTENLERLLVVAKEKERLESEIEIAREVQNQLYPKIVPVTRSLRLTAECRPARMVSGDYYDYELLFDGRVALAIGDVAGKGISAALLMATLQSSLRAQLRSSMEAAVPVGGGTVVAAVRTAQLVSRLNRQLYATTAPEKYATFFFGLFDETAGVLTYTNAGHLPPILVHGGMASRLDVNGTVVGAFPASEYEESRVELERGDLLVCFTDGISEPENEYGEMFGEERLADLVTKNAHRRNDEILASVMEAVEQWTGGGEQQDDMTILLARRL
ncbi:MAG: SpoIIE family protein phosphatase [Bryobacteraceae bacterium]